jgi:hypothetical protein
MYTFLLLSKRKIRENNNSRDFCQQAGMNIFISAIVGGHVATVTKLYCVTEIIVHYFDVITKHCRTVEKGYHFQKLSIAGHRERKS